MRKTQKAFTLIELLVAMVVLAVVVAIAIPSFNLQILNNRSVVLAEDFVTEINLARYEAVRRATRVSVCASSDGETCSGAWTDGFITFIDAALADNEPTPIVLQILRTWPKPDDRAFITVQLAGADVSFFRYTSLGTLARIGNAANTVDLITRMEGCKNENQRSITIGLTGLVSINKQSCP